MSYEEAKLTLEEQEALYPTSFLTADGTYRRNLIGEWVLKGNVGSTATVAKYKDVVLAISYYSKTETLLGTEQQTIYDYFHQAMRWSSSSSPSASKEPKALGLRFQVQKLQVMNK